jgi:predicted DNA-binding transcriptional regulator YafY
VKRKAATAAELEAGKRAFWDTTAQSVLQRGALAVRQGKAIEQRDRAFIALALDELAERERAKLKALTPARLRAYLADYLQTKLRIDLEQAVAAVAGDCKPDSVRKAVDRLRAARRQKGRARR